MNELEAVMILLRSSVKCEFFIPKLLYHPNSTRLDDLMEAEDYLTEDKTVKISKYYTARGFKIKVEKIQK